MKSSISVPIIEIPLDNKKVRLFVKREDLTHPEISGNKYWKLFYNVKNYLALNKKNPFIITFGGAFSNHIAATAAVGKTFGVRTLGIIRGEELAENWQKNPTLTKANENGMQFLFVSRESYRDKEKLTRILQNQYTDALIIPEGGTNEWAVEGIKFMLDERTKDFDYLCTAVGTGGTMAGLVKHSDNQQKVLGFKVVKDHSLAEKIAHLSGKENFALFEAHEGRYGKITDETIDFINHFYNRYNILLDPIYTGKTMRFMMNLINENEFPENARILAFHTGGLQGIWGANEFLKKQKRQQINY